MIIYLLLFEFWDILFINMTRWNAHKMGSMGRWRKGVTCWNQTTMHHVLLQAPLFTVEWMKKTDFTCCCILGCVTSRITMQFKCKPQSQCCHDMQQHRSPCERVSFHSEQSWLTRCVGFSWTCLCTWTYLLSFPHSTRNTIYVCWNTGIWTPCVFMEIVWVFSSLHYLLGWSLLSMFCFWCWLLS